MLGELFNNPLSFIIWVIALLTAITVHEFSHALIANHLGDPTAKLSGRLTLNPLAHLDLMGTIFLLLVHFGWGKPVPVDPFNLQNPKRDSALISLAGPVSNLILAVLLSFLLRLSFLPATFYLLPVILIPVIYLNVALAIFNLLPISPLDGFKIVGGLLPKDLSLQWDELESYGIIFLLLLISPLGGSLLTNIISPVISLILNLLIPGTGRVV